MMVVIFLTLGSSHSLAGDHHNHNDDRDENYDGIMMIIITEMQKAASVASTLVLIFGSNCANFWTTNAQRLCNC